MCGIAGFRLRGEAASSRRILLERMLTRLEHRGPDARGLHMDGAVGLGNQRLGIIDPEGGCQPVANEDGDVVVVFNGEIYGFGALREELARKGHALRTRSDTEVLVHLYEEEGIDFVERLDGMFAFALHDRRRDLLWLVRDRFGIKPLFWTRTSEGVFFASELRALLEVPGFDSSLDPEAVAIYLSQGYVPQPWTIFRGARRLEAGHALRLSADGVDEVTWFDFDLGSKIAVGRREAEEELLRLLDRSVARQLVADVPVGLFLSSGLDSTAVLSSAAEAGKRLPSFTLAFDDRDHDEDPGAAAWSGLLGCPHHRVPMAEADLVGGIEARMAHSAEPLAPWINVGRELLARSARSRGIKVALNGAGGDELFCGYPTLQAALVARRYGALPASLRERFAAPLLEHLPAGRGPLPTAFVLRAFSRATRRSDPFHVFFDFKSVIGRDEWGDLITPDAVRWLGDATPHTAVERHRPQLERLELVDALRYLDTKNFLEGSVLFLGDNATMAASLEERVPFLDADLAAFAFSLPHQVVFRMTATKPLLRSALSRRLRDVGGARRVRRARKRGFELPANAWSRKGALRDHLERRLARSAVEKTGFFRAGAVRRILDEHFAGTRNNERVLQCLLGFQRFLESRPPA